MGGIWFVGCGNMGGAMLARWLDTGMAPESVTVIDPQMPALPEGVRVLAEPLETLPPPEFVVLAVKPQMLDQVVPLIAPRLGVGTLLVSILAGIKLAALRERFVAPHNIVRAMPNMPVALGRGVVALVGENRDAAETAGLTSLMERLGLAEWMESEGQFDAVTALSGSGPAFVYRFIDAMAASGAALGLPPEQALRMALATVDGAAGAALASPNTPGELARQVASPGGTTERGLSVLDEDGALATLVRNTLRAAAERSKEMAALANGADR
jgi:pyrroline-5-carboxylate reductase